ncbi:hypothetical protein GQ457_05G011670 [Hibiscus cannabinus]
MTFQDPWYRYPSGGIDTQVSILGTDTQREYRYPRAVFQKGYRYPKPWYRYPLSRMAELAEKSSPTAPNKVQRSPTARITFGTIKQASKHQEKANASLYNIIMMKNCLSA